MKRNRLSCLQFSFRGSYLVCAALFALAGCASQGPVSQDRTCSVAPPDTIKSDRSLALEAAADLTKFAKAPVSANVKASINDIFNATFQKVTDTAAACAMLNQTYVCITDKERADQYLVFMKETKQCSR